MLIVKVKVVGYRESSGDSGGTVVIFVVIAMVMVHVVWILDLRHSLMRISSRRLQRI